jgi:hypothetical protein
MGTDAARKNGEEKVENAQQYLNHAHYKNSN